MNKPTIGIRQADGSFYPIIDESYEGKKCFLLSIAKQNANNIKFDIFRSLDGTLATAQRMGTLALPRKENDPTDLELSLEIDAQGHLTASSAFVGQSSAQSFTIDLSDYQEEQKIPSDQEILSDPQFQDSELDLLELPESETTEDTNLLQDTLLQQDFEHFDDNENLEETQRTDQDVLQDEIFQDADLDELKLDEDSFENSIEDPFENLTTDQSTAEENSTPEPIDLDLPKEDLPESDNIFELEPDKNEDDLSLESQPEVSSLEKQENDFGDQNFSFAEESPQPLQDSSWEKKADSEMLESQESFTLTDFAQEEPKTTFDQNIEKTHSTKAAKKKNKAVRSDESDINHTVLVLCLVTVGLLVITLLTLLFLNMVKPSQIPSIKPETMKWQERIQIVQPNQPSVQPLNLLWNERQKLPDLKTDRGLLSIPISLKTCYFFYRPFKNERIDDLSRSLGFRVESLQQGLFIW